MNNREIGAYFEERAVEFLKTKGYTILEKNFRCHMGEIDIIAMDQKYLVFIEVKYRKNDKKGNPKYAVNLKKQQVISKTAAYYMLKHQIREDLPCRFDVVAITDDHMELVKNAFDYRGY